MSCDENKEARAKARGRSLPIVSGAAPAAAPGLWRSMDERQGAASVALGGVNEFPAGASELDGVSRRNFMQLLGASTALATVGAACRKPNEKIVPFVRRPEEVTPGNALHFATAYSLEGYGSGLLVESWEGRPTKVEGTPEHPDTLGATSAFDQALILGLYDEDRIKQLRHGGEPLAWRTFLTHVAARAEKQAAGQGAGLRFLVEPTGSPLLLDLRRRILERFPKATFTAYSPVSGDGAIEGARAAFGKAVVARHQIEKAQVILSLDADFLGDGPEQTRMTRGFASRREPGATMNRLYVVEPALTITGMMADHRLRVRAGDVAGFAAALVRQLAGRIPALGGLAGLPQSGGPAPDAKWLAAVAADLESARGKGLVVAGRRQPAAVHALAAALNVALGNEGSTVTYAEPVVPDASTGAGALGALAEDIAAGTVDTLVITAHNPVYTAPVDLKLAQLLKRVPNTIYHGLYDDETAALCNTVIPAAHPLESWCDAAAFDGTVSIVQPLIAPLWGGVAESEVLAAFVGEGDVGAHELVRRHWQGQGAGTRANGAAMAAFDGTWEKWLADGIVPQTAAAATDVPAIDAGALAGALAPLLSRKLPGGDGLELAYAPDYKVWDGRFANNAWLQELPHPVTKITWDNAVMISEATAKGLDLETGDVVAIEYRQRSVEGPVLIVPGHADDAVTLPLGYGRAAAKQSVAYSVGFNAGAVRASDAAWFDRGAKLTKLGRKHKFAITQDHWTMAPDGRKAPPPAVAAPLAEVMKEGSPFHEELEERRGPQPVIHKPVDYSKQPYKWAMAIDLNKCTGCSACVVACQSENNIPVVGKDNVIKGREMQWLRIDRYFSGAVSDPEVVLQPLACVHCETAPCEYVCPVNATVHSDEGLNEMAYNRCIGTRYCSNNCPYKVRRFNFLDYTGDTPAARQLGMNPEVTVRSRGVMEKCTYCVQRIERRRIETRIENRPIRDGELQTACQQGCPADAIVFGSLNDPASRVSRLHADARRYDLLHEIGTRPRTAYLARVRNPNPELAMAHGEAAGGESSGHPAGHPEGH